MTSSEMARAYKQSSHLHFTHGRKVIGKVLIRNGEGEIAYEHLAAVLFGILSGSHNGGLCIGHDETGDGGMGRTRKEQGHYRDDLENEQCSERNYLGWMKRSERDLPERVTVGRANGEDRTALALRFLN